MVIDLHDAFERPSDAKKPKAVRRDHDAYMTPPTLVDSIVKAFEHLQPARVLEPSCGEGEFVLAMRRTWPNAQIVGVDIRPEVGPKIEASGAAFVASDFLLIPPSALAHADLIITNPPYSLIHDFIRHALNGMRNDARLVLLMRFGHLVGSLDAQAWWRTPLENGLTPARQIVRLMPVFPRPSFTGGGTDQTEYCVAVFLKGIDNGGLFDPITWDKPTVRRGRPRKTTNGER
jgi:hypothetical protein